MHIRATLTSSPVRCWMTQHRNSSEESLQCGLGLYVAHAMQKSAMKECIAVTHAEANVLYQVDYSTVTVSKCLDVQYRYFFYASSPLIAVDGGNLFFCFFLVCLSIPFLDRRMYLKIASREVVQIWHLDRLQLKNDVIRHD